jgi:hypothetical protein
MKVEFSTKELEFIYESLGRRSHGWDVYQKIKGYLEKAKQKAEELRHARIANEAAAKLVEEATINYEKTAAKVAALETEQA